MTAEEIDAIAAAVATLVSKRVRLVQEAEAARAYAAAVAEAEAAEAEAKAALDAKPVVNRKAA